ncbi:serine/threonine protein kinase [Fimbriiglobus ruber]|uniref:Serine/threonine protein kinase PrkC, regulator of stationary phase n=1 Tax=Fimbriiglobus ruber TaxID=1908690 RepID=A0A225D1R1_9BACT|nr:serine/threonine-protein kinase [Fimbriiglobus ruber]OWK34863.1 Serine/threonine protein kinase PrkC, regulator of stationary phase [Fimbriiglobus ruber]
MDIGLKIGPFEIEKELGSGAMGTVYRASFHKEDSTVIPVALKVVSYGLLGNESAMARFDREATILKQLKHPNIVRLFATGRYKKTPFIAMEYVEGESLDRVIARRGSSDRAGGRLGWEEVVQYGKQLCRALQHAHDKGIIHRDLKPSNLMVTRDGVLKLTDFGIAKDTDVTALTNANSTIGTASYMSPEQCKGDRNLSNKSDLYSLGIVFYELLTGIKPFTAETTVDMFMKHVAEEPVRPSKALDDRGRPIVPDLPIWLDNLVMHLMEKDKKNRPLDATKVEESLKEIEEKVQSQQSVGAEVANSRRKDRPLRIGSVNEDDLDAARSLRDATASASGKRRKKKKKDQAPPRRLWLKGLGLALGLVVIAGVITYAIWPESSDAAFAKVESAATSEGKYEAAAAFMGAFGKRESDPKVAQQLAQARTIYRDEQTRKAERVLANKFGSKFQGSGIFPEEPYKLAMQAMEAEKAGTLKKAAELWAATREGCAGADLSKLPDEGETNKAVLGWVAEKRIKELTTDVEAAFRKVTDQIAKERIYETPRTYDTKNPEGDVVRGILFEEYLDPAKARAVWDSLAAKTEREADQRMWYLIATRQAAQLGVAKGGEDDVKAARVKRLEALITKMEADSTAARADANAAVVRRSLRNQCRDIISLYDDEQTDAIKAVVDRAKKLLESLPK